jgi:hypothetical protein
MFLYVGLTVYVVSALALLGYSRSMLKGWDRAATSLSPVPWWVQAHPVFSSLGLYGVPYCRPTNAHWFLCCKVLVIPVVNTLILLLALGIGLQLLIWSVLRRAVWERGSTFEQWKNKPFI